MVTLMVVVEAEWIQGKNEWIGLRAGNTAEDEIEDLGFASVLYEDGGESWRYRRKASFQKTKSKDLKIEKLENGDGPLVWENLGVE